MNEIVERSIEVSGNPLFNIASEQQVGNAIYNDIYFSEKPIKIHKHAVSLIAEEIIHNAKEYLLANESINSSEEI